MKKISVISLVILALVLAISGQSGRRSKVSPTPSATPEDHAARGQQNPDDPAGYSESAPNAARLIWAKPENKKKSKTAANTRAASPDAPVSPDTAGDEEVIKVDTSIVTVPVSVHDRNGLYVPNLSQLDFKIFEDGVEQEIAYFGTTEKPFTVVLLIDVSSSTQYKIEDIQHAAVNFVDLLKPSDNVLVIQFDESVSVLTELTNDREKIYKAIRRTGFGGGTSLYDAVDFSLRKRLDKIEGRKAIVLFTDGVDTTSGRASFESTLRAAEESESLIFPIYYNTFLSSIGIGTGGVMSTPPVLGIPGSGRPRGARSEDYTRGRAYLTELAAITGGRVFRAESTPGGLSAAFEGIAEELSRQYSIGYFPRVEGEAGQRKQIKVRVNRPKLVIRSRDSYIVGSNKTAST